MEQLPSRLDGKVAVVTGAGGEIGCVIARELLGAGALVVWAGQREKALRALVASQEDGRERSLIVRLDVREEASVRRMVVQVLKRWRRIDILVNNAAVRGPTRPATELSRKEWRQVIETNLTGPFLCARECLKQMVPRREGCIINISSVAGRIAYPLRVSYAASKWGLIGLTMTLAQEAGAAGVRVNAILPGPVEGEAMQEVVARRARATGVSLHAMRKQFVRPTALGRMVTPQDVSRLVLFLCSDAAKNITGQAIEVSAGFGLWPGG